jgi:hypothetical protein
MAAAAAAFELNWLHNKHHYTGETGATDSHCFCNGAQEVKYTIIDLGYEKNTEPPACRQARRAEREERETHSPASSHHKSYAAAIYLD